MVLSASVFLAACSEEDVDDVTDQIQNVAQMEDPNVVGVKNGHPSNYPDQTYGEAFGNFFAYPTWKYFKGEKEGPDDDGDGKPDYTESDIDVVEFTGRCTYSDTEVKALLQFTLDKESDTFQATYLSFNDVPQSTLMMMGLLDTVFTENEEDKDAESTEEDFDDMADGTNWDDSAPVIDDGSGASTGEQILSESGNAAELDGGTNGSASLPSDIKVDSEKIEYAAISGNYGGMQGMSSIDLSMYSSPENNSVGNADVYVQGGEYSYTGEISEVATNVYKVANTEGKDVLLAVSTQTVEYNLGYDQDSGTLWIQLYVDGELIEEYMMLEHYES